MKTSALLLLLFVPAAAQPSSPSTERLVSLGVEADALPFLTGGYYASVWAGHDHLRYRAILTRLTTPEFALPDGFTNNDITAYTLIADYFFEPGFSGWWVGAGAEYWSGSIQAETKRSTAKYHNTILTAGGGHVWKFYKNLYLNPWGAVHLRVGGDTAVGVDGTTFEPALFQYEVSLKLGWHFDL